MQARRERLMSGRALLTGIGYALLALALALVVIVPAFLAVNWLYDNGRGLTPLLVVTVVAWLVLSVLLSRRRVML
jgi:hypothetical protein